VSKAEENLFPFVTLVESDPDGSAVDTPPSGARRIFPGDDGGWYDKDDGGDVDAISGGGGGGFSSGDVDEAILASNVALGTTAYGDDLLSLTLDAGFYLVQWKMAVSIGGSHVSIFAVLWDSTEATIYDEDEDTIGSASSGWRLSGPHGWAFITLGSTTTIKLSASRSSDASASALRDGGNSTSHRLTKLSAIKLG
jgi:hypothetical protein